MSLILLWEGCHAFQTLEIPCLAGEPCASAGDDTSVPTAPVSQWVVSYDGPNHTAMVENHGPDGSTIDTWELPDTSAGPVAWSVGSASGVFLDGGRIFALRPDVAPTYVGEVTNSVAAADVESVGDYLWFAIGDNLYASDLDVWFKVFDLDLSRADHLGQGDGILYLTAETDQGVDLYSVDPAAVTWQPVYQHLNGPRARNVFSGPGGAPFACSAAGAVYALDSLATGSAATVAFYSGTLSDVRDCGYDPGDDRYLLFSPTEGVLKIDARGTGEVLTGIPTGYAGIRANFYR